jgi:hypothetical protein
MMRLRRALATATLSTRTYADTTESPGIYRMAAAAFASIMWSCTSLNAALRSLEMCSTATISRFLYLKARGARAMDWLRSEQRTPSVPPSIETVVPSQTDVLRQSASLWLTLSRRIAAETGEEVLVPLPEGRTEPDWQEVAPGIFCKLLATDRARHRVSMLVHLTSGVAYPPHTHAGVEELYLLHGELMIEDRKLYPGAYNRGEPGESDQFVWSRTGCVCVLVTSTQDVLRHGPPAGGKRSIQS